MRILLVEDDDFLRRVYTDRFAEADYEVTGAEDGEQGLARLREGRYDLVLCDVLLPKMDGLAMLQAARDAGCLEGVSVIMLTNIDDADERAKAAALGVKGYFLKAGMNVDELAQLVQVIVPHS
jgi:DNA-binding response OmpR family regulator